MGGVNTKYYLFCVLIGLSYGLLDKPQTTTQVPSEFDASETRYLHQLLNQESLMRMQLETQILSLQNSMAAMTNKQMVQESKIQSLDTELAQYKSNEDKLQNTTNTVLHLLQTGKLNLLIDKSNVLSLVFV